MEQGTHRVIKFRAWDGQEMLNDWLTVLDVVFGIVPSILARKAEVVMQFTGLTDKNGKEIYDGDIIEVGEQTGSISWEPHLLRWQINFVDENVGDALGDYWQHLLPTMIGNIYENPELLK